MNKVLFFCMVFAGTLSLCGCTEGVAEETVATPDSFIESLDSIITEEDLKQGVSQESLDALNDTESLGEDTRTELLVETLQEAGKDPSIVEGKIKTKGLSFSIPEGFAPSEEDKNLYVTRRYPLDASNIYYTETEEDQILQLMTEDAYKAMVEANYKEQYGFDIALSIESFEPITIDEIPAFRILSTYDLEGLHITQLTFIVNADKTYLLTYSMTNEYDKMEGYLESAETITVNR